MSKKKAAAKKEPSKPAVKRATAGGSKASAKPASASKAQRATAASAANPVRPADVMRPAGAPPADPAVLAARRIAESPAAMGPAPGQRLPFRRPQVVNFAGVGRNDMCPCGSGKRFKNCHG